MMGTPAIELTLEDPPQLGVRHAGAAQLVDQGSDLFAGLREQDDPITLNRGLCYEGTRTMPQLDPAGVLELAVGLGHRIRIDHQVLSHSAHAGELIAGSEEAGGNSVLDLLDQLQVHRHTG